MSNVPPAAPPTAPSERGSPERQTSARMIPFIVGCALFMQMLDATVIAIALPAIADSLHTTPVRLNMAITAYLLAAAVFVPISGWAADRFGARRVFLTAIGLFVASSLACALAQSVLHLVLARVAQGLAGAMMVPVGRIILLRTVPKDQLLKAMSFLSIPALVGPIVGPLLGGFLVTYASWHWIFLINLPIGLLGVALVLRYVAEVRIEDTPPLDLSGFLLSGTSLALLVFCFDAAGHQLLPPMLLLALTAVGLVSGMLYLRHARRTPFPIIDLTLLRIPTFAISTLGGNLSRFAIGATPFLLALMLQIGFGMTPLAAGTITFASAAGALLMKFVAAPIIRRYGFRRVLMHAAWLAGALVAAIALFYPGMSPWVMIIILLVGGFFRSLQFTAVNTLSYADIEPEHMSRASSLAAMAQQLGISVGVAVAAVTLNTSMALRGAPTLGIEDIRWGFLTVGLLCMCATLSFRRLAPQAGAQLNAGQQ